MTTTITRGRERQSIEELGRRRFAVTLTDRHNHRVDDVGAVITGPAILEVVITRATVLSGSRAGIVCHPTYSVVIDGTHRTGGFADHLPASGIPALPWVILGPELPATPAEEPDDELCDHIGTERITRIAHGYLGDRPAGTIEALCVECGGRVDDFATTNAGSIRPGDVIVVDTTAELVLDAVSDGTRVALATTPEGRLVRAATIRARVLPIAAPVGLVR